MGRPLHPNDALLAFADDGGLWLHRIESDDVQRSFTMDEVVDRTIDLFEVCDEPGDIAECQVAATTIATSLRRAADRLEEWGKR